MRANVYLKQACRVRNLQGMRAVIRLILAQAIVASGVSIVVCITLGFVYAKAALLGGFVGILPNALFARRLFRHAGAHAAKKIVTNFYQGEALKLLSAIALFALVFKYIKPVPWIFFAVYILVQLIFWLSPLIMESDRRGIQKDASRVDQINPH